MLIDVHSHATFGIGREPPVDVVWSPERALALMDQHHITTSIISVPNAANYSTGQQAIDIARRINDKLAELVARHPKRFAAFATLPGREPEAALNEIEYALDTLKLDGIATTTNIDDVYLGSPPFDPWLEELDRRAAALFIHPINLSASPKFDLGIDVAILEFVFDTTRMLVNMLITGTKERFSRINMISTHGGGAMPYVLSRIQTLIAALGAGPGHAPITAARIKSVLASFYYDLTGSTSNAQLVGLRDLVPVSRLFMGFDIPYMPEWSIGPAIEAVRNHPGFDAADRRDLAYGNVLRLFPALAARLNAARPAPLDDHAASV